MNLGKIISYFISRMPFNSVRVFLYKQCNIHMGKNVKIGYGTTLPVTNLCDVHIGNNVRIGKHNEFNRGQWLDKYKKTISILAIGKNVEITKYHFFDLSDDIIIDDDTIIGGKDSEFWTHGAKKPTGSIYIFSNSYVGSRALFMPNVMIMENTVVGAGSVVTKKFSEKNITIAGNPAKIIKHRL